MIAHGLIESVSETGSTNADLLVLARQGTPEGYWLRADIQTGGRGRLGRNWSSPRGNLYASTLVRVTLDDPPAHTLSLVTAVALHDSLRHFAPRADLIIKWPNDLLLQGNKLAGILLERQDDAVIVGMGVNLAFAPQLPDRVTAALSQIIAVPEPDVFCAELAVRFAQALAFWREQGLSATIEQWMVRAHPIGTMLSTTNTDGARIMGEFSGLDEDAMLNLRLPGGESVTIHSGDIEMERSGGDATRN